MDLSQCIVLPGIVIDVEDPKHIGRVKAMVPTIFDSDYMNKEAMPWVYPFGMCGYQRFSKLENGRKIWVLHNKENKLEYWYWPMFEETQDTKSIVEKYDSSEVLLSRTSGENGNVFVYYNDSDGIVLTVGKTKINITTNNEIHMNDGNVSVRIVGGQVFLGEEGNEEYTVKGETLKSNIETLSGIFQQLYTASTTASTPAQLSPFFMQIKNQLDTLSKNLLSEKVKIS